jgi:Helix-turn-helix domain
MEVFILPNPEYKKDEYIHFIYEKTGEYQKVKGKNNSERMQPKYNQIEIPFNKIESLNLNNRGESVPYSHKNVINFSRYMAWYWCPIIGADACMLYMHLTEYCDDTDICYPKIDELADKMKRSKPTVNKNLDILEENNFIIIIHRLNKLANNKETSPIFKLRHTIPLLSKEQYFMLSKKLQKKHDEFMEKYGAGRQEFIPYDHSQTLDELLMTGEKIISKSARSKIDNILKNEQEKEYLLVKLSKYDTVKLEGFHQALMQAGFSKPSFDLFFRESISVYIREERSVHIIVKDESTKDYLKQEHAKTYALKILKAVESLYEENIKDVSYYTIRDYIYKLERGK